MRQQLVYDLPTRLFHWIFAGFFLTAFIIAKTVDDESLLFSYHSLAGLMLGFTVILRIIWGMVGTKHARFTGFALRPTDLIKYMKGILSGDKTRWAGHNPASSWAAIVMMLLALSLGTTGYLMSTGGKETFEDIHEILANTFIVVVVMHVAGVILHTIRHREAIGLSMLDGKKADVPIENTILSSRSAIGILFLGLTVAFGIHLYNNFDTNSGNLKFMGANLQLGEDEVEVENDDD
ncbi:MAG: cytochrome b/b6 domain-containing protein [Oligoflexia bacterium]|nr:cytochrome b/b6 domain-containing protein [Oligoflexia bacterium]